MVSSNAYPGLERKPGGPDNWVEATAGLPRYIERIAKHLHYEQGYTISHAIATAVNTVKRWAAGGTVTKSGTTKRVTAKTRAQAAKAVAEWEAKKAAAKGTNLAEPDISATATMVAFMLPSDVAGDIAIPGGVEADDLHITLCFNGEVEDDDGYNEIVDRVRDCVSEYGEPLKGTIGGIGAFPAGDQGTPWLALVDVPGLSEFRYHLVEALRGSDHPANEEHGYTPHVTIAYDDQPEPLAATPVEFSSVWVVRGNEQRTEIPLDTPDSADEPEDGTLPPRVGRPEEAKVELSALLERARTISDPEQKARVRAYILDLAVSAEFRKKAKAKHQTIPGTDSFPIPNEEYLRRAIQAYGRAKDKAAAKRHIISRARSLGLTRLLPKQWKVDLAEAIACQVVDLALTKDGRKSFKNQGKWRHGFVPVDDAAVTSKAKGSPIARRRILRIFGKDTRVGEVKSAPPVTVKAKGGGTVTARSAARLGSAAEAKDATATQRVNPKAKREVSRGRGNTSRATKPWNEVPDSGKTIRNGKRYVVATFAGKQQLTEWVGPKHGSQVKADPADGLYASITLDKAMKFDSGQLRRLLAVPGQPDHVKRILNAALAKQNATTRKPKGVAA